MSRVAKFVTMGSRKGRGVARLRRELELIPLKPSSSPALEAASVELLSELKSDTSSSLSRLSLVPPLSSVSCGISEITRRISKSEPSSISVLGRTLDDCQKGYLAFVEGDETRAYF